MTTSYQKQHFIQNFIFFLSDIICITLSYIFAIVTRGIVFDVYKNPQYYFLIILFIFLLSLLSYFTLSLNQNIFNRGYLAEFFAVFKYNFFIGCGLGVFLFLTQKAQDFSRLAFVFFISYNIIITYLFRICIKPLFTKWAKSSPNSNKLLIITSESSTNDIFTQLKTMTEWTYQITGLGIIDKDLVGQNLQGVPVRANRENIFEIMNQIILDEIFIYLPNESPEFVQQIVENFEYAGIRVHMNVNTFEHLICHRTCENFAGFPVITFNAADYDLHQQVIKRTIDIFGSIFGMILTISIFPFLALAIKIDSKGPILYSQKRVGRSGRVFTLYKFRSMYIDAESKKEQLLSLNEADGPFFKISNDPRITRVGKFIRKTSLDEFPQFFQVFSGKMSLVGTRPPTLDEYTQYNPIYRRRLSIKPGLTGLWQVSGRSKINSFDEVVKLDLRYIDNWSLGLDIKIIFQTLLVLLKRDGAM